MTTTMKTTTKTTMKTATTHDDGSIAVGFRRQVHNMTKEEIKKEIHQKLDQIAAELKQNRDVIIKTTKNGIKIQSMDYKKV